MLVWNEKPPARMLARVGVVPDQVIVAVADDADVASAWNTDTKSPTAVPLKWASSVQFALLLEIPDANTVVL
jgi:hypothetical protein